jgi:TP901 family phage tail tape measure protein
MADVQSNIKVSIDTTQALASIKNLQRQISAFHTSMAQSGAAANAVTGQMQQNLINSINATGKFSAQMKTIKTTTESFTDSLQKNKFSLGEYFRYAGGASKSFGQLFKTEFETINKVARENVKDLQTQYIKMGRDANGAMKAIAVRPLSLDMNDLATKTMIASEKQALLNQLLKQGSTNLLNFGKNTQWAGRQLMVGFTIPLMAAGTAAAKSFMDMEKQAIRFKKVYGDLFTSTEESTAALENIKELGKSLTQYGIAVADTVGVASEAAAAGFAGVDLQRQTEQSIRLSILGQVDYQKALETTISVQNAFGISSDQLAESIDFLNAVENQTVVSLDDITTAIPKVAPVIKQLGGDVKDLAFLMTAMKEGGINASEGANALKSGLASMINPTGKAAAMLEGFGININKIVIDNKGDLKKTIVEFATALNQLDPLNRAQAIEQMFGKFQFARLSTLFANVTKEGTQAARVLDLAGSSVQELAALSEKELGMTAESSMNKFKKAVEDLKLALVPVGEEFLKAVTPVAEFIAKILEKFNGLSDGTKKIIVTITAIVAGLGPVFLMTFGLLANGLANIIKGFTFLKTIFNKAGQSTATLGTEVKYMTLEQRNAAAVAASLDQVHRNLAQTFTAEASAVDALTRAYQRSIAAQNQFVPSARPMVRGPIKKRAEGKPAVVGGTGNKDSELSWLMPGETVIPTKMSKKYGSLINGMIADSIPGYGGGKVSMYPEYALRLQDAAENMGQRSGTTGVPNVLAPLALRIGEARGIAPTSSQINSGSFDDIYREYEDITTNFVDKLNSEYTETFKDIKDENERMQKSWSSAGKHVAEQVDTIKSETERGVVKKTFGLEKDEYGTIPTDSRDAGGTTPNRARRGAFKAKLAGFRSYTAIRPGAKKLFSRMTGKPSDSLQMGHVYGPIQEDISTLQADPRRSGAVDSAAKILARGEKDGKEYKKGVEKSVKDPYVSSLDRSSPHPLAAKHGKEDGVAYQTAKEKAITQSGKARRVAVRAQGPAPIGPAMPAGATGLTIVAPLTDSEKRKESKKQSKLAALGKVKSAGMRMNSFGGNMGLMGVNMGLSMMPDFAGKGLAQGALAGANLGSMFGPWGMAAGASIGLVSSAISGLIERQKELKAVNEATFKGSAEMATFFGNAIVDTTLKVGSFSASATDAAKSVEGLKSSLSITNEQIASFKALVESLPTDNPIRVIVDEMTKEDDPEKILKIANAFIETQVAIGNIDTTQAQAMLDMYLTVSAHSDMVGSSFIRLKSQSEAVSNMLNRAGMSSKDLGNALLQLTGAAANTTSLEQMKAIIDGIAASGRNGADAIDALYNAFKRNNNKEGALSVQILEGVKGMTLDKIASAIAAAANGLDIDTTKLNTVEKIMTAVNDFNAKRKKALSGSVSNVETKAFKDLTKESNVTKSQIDLLKKKKKVIDDQIKQQEKITNELKRQNDYLDKQRDLDQQIVDAKVKGDYIGAASLLQEKSQNTVEFNQDTQKSELQSKSDALQAQIDALQEQNDKVVSAINAASAAQVSATNAVRDAILNLDPGSVTGPTVTKTDIKDVGKVDGPTEAQVEFDPATNTKVVTDRLHTSTAKLRGGKFAWKQGDVVQIGVGKDIDGLQTKDGIKPRLTGTAKITKIDRDANKFWYIFPEDPDWNKYASGGKITGPGTSKSDSIPALLSDGEYVIKASSVAKYGTDTMDALNAGKYAKGGSVAPSWKKPSSPYNSKNQPTGSPYGRYWGELERLYQGSPIGFDKNGKPIFNNAGKDPWGGVEIPGLPFSGKVGQFSDYWHQLAEQARKSSGPGMGIDRSPDRYAGSGASTGGIGNGAYGATGLQMFANGGSVMGFATGGNYPQHLFDMVKRANTFNDLAPHNMGMKKFPNPGIANSAPHDMAMRSVMAEPEWARSWDYWNPHLPEFTDNQKPESLPKFALNQLKTLVDGKIPPLSAFSVLKNVIQRFESRETGAGIGTYLPESIASDEGTSPASIRTPYYKAQRDSGYGKLRPVYLDVKDYTSEGKEDRKRNLASIYMAANELTKLTGVPFRVIKPENREKILAAAAYSKYTGPKVIPIQFLEKEALREARGGKGPIGSWWAMNSGTITMPRAKQSDTWMGLNPFSTAGGKEVAMHEIIHSFQGHLDGNGECPMCSTTESSWLDRHLGAAQGNHSLNPFNIMNMYGLMGGGVSNKDIESIRNEMGYYQYKTDLTPEEIKLIQRKIQVSKGSRFANGGLANYKLPSYEVGSPYIPEDQIAQLHKGERVLTAQENKNFSSTGPVTNNITINGADKDPKQIAQEVMLQLERMQSKNNKTNLVGR